MSPKCLRLALIGFGNVGQGFVDLLKQKSDLLAGQYSLQTQIVAVGSLEGSLLNPNGLDANKLLAAAKTRDLANYADEPGLRRGIEPSEIIAQPNIDVVIETTFTNFETGEPALGYVRAALGSGKHVILTNKGPVALAYGELAKLAERNNVFFGYEGTVMSGTPSLRLARQALAGSTINEARGILNGTTNYILTQMENGASYQDALAEAQRLSYAEADPTGDVDGHDAAGKLVILANVVFNAALRVQDVDRTGITKLTQQDIQTAKTNGQRWKLIAKAWRDGNQVKASVKPVALPIADPLAGVGGATNAITYETDTLGAVTLIGPGAGRKETGFAILADLMEIAQHYGNE